MPTFVADSEDAVIAAIRAGVIPEQVLQNPARVLRSTGALRIRPTGEVPQQAARELQRLGFQIEDTALADGGVVGSWPEIIEPRRGPEPVPATAQVLFVAPRANFAELVGTLLRLGADRQEIAFFDTDGGELCATKVVDPPYYVTLSSAEGGAVRGYVEQTSRVWVELGFEHPLANDFVVPDGELLLVGASRSMDEGGHPLGRWARLQDGPWRSIYEHVDLVVPGPLPLSHVQSDARLEVELKLVAATQRDAPTLWILRSDAVASLDRLVQSLPESVLRALAFVRLKSADGALVAIRVRTGHEPPVLELADAEAYVPLHHVDNLFIPLGSVIRPPLRRERLRDELAPDADTLCWLARTNEAGAFRVEHAPAGAFEPLVDWVDHVAAEDAVGLEPWLHNAIFEFDDFVGVEPVRASAPVAAETSTPEPVRAVARRPQQRVMATSTTRRRDRRAAPLDVQSAAPSELETELQSQEALLVDQLGRGEIDVPSWLDLGAVYDRMGRPTDAALAFTHALWELEPGDPQWDDVVETWAMTEDRHDSRFDSDFVRADLAGALDGLAASRDVDVAWLRQTLEAHADSIPTRVAWLVYEALARQTGDELGYVRAQDAMRVRLRGGLRIADDVPGFVRRLGKDISGHASARLAETLIETLETYQATTRTRSEAEKAPELTDGYVMWLFAWGFAQLGESAQSARLSQAAHEAHTGADDAIHLYLRSAFQTRVEHARTGRGPHAPLPLELHQQLEALPRMDRYKVDRLRQASLLLEGRQVDAFGRFRSRDAALDITNPGELPARVDEGIANAATDGSGLRRAAALMQLLPTYDALPRLDALLAAMGDRPAEERVSLLDDALLVARAAKSAPHLRVCVDALTRILAELRGSNLELSRDAARVLNRHVVVVRRLGRERDVTAVLRESVEQFRGRLALAHLEVATLMAALGDDAEVETAVQTSFTFGGTHASEWLAWNRQRALALSRISPDHAIAGTQAVMPQLRQVTDRFQTNTHFCLSVLHFMESMVLGLARADLALSDAARRIIDADEQRVRRRIFGHFNRATEET